jgi:hypothetical protein
MTQDETLGTTAVVHKRPYQRPSLEKVELRAEEAVLGACKGTIKAGPFSGTCRVPIIGRPCSVIGS